MRRFPVLLLASLAAAGAATPPPAPGVLLRERLRSFGATGTLLHIAAHPDDENTHLITHFARARGFRAGYLSLTRGDGGQNEIGPEFDAKLGVARTQELLEARKLDGGVQFFTRAIDFGYSKTAEETLRFWDRREVLGDVVRVIRQFRPDVIVTRFSPRGGGTHGHHTASGILGAEAFRLAADPAAYPEHVAEGLRPWQARRVVLNAGGPGRGGGEGGLRIDLGGVDPATGEGLGTIAGRSRARHITQGFGSFGARGGGAGPNEQTFVHLGGEPATGDLFDGVDTTWARLGPAGAELAEAAAAAWRAFRVEEPATAVPALLELRRRLAALPSEPLVADRRRQLDDLIRDCLGVEVGVTAERTEVTPGAAVRFALEARRGASTPVRLREVRLGTRLVPVAPGELGTGAAGPREFVLPVPLDQPLSQPYWLREEGAAGLFAVPDPTLIGRPEDQPAFVFSCVLETLGETLVVEVPGEAVETGPAGPRRRRVDVVAPVVIELLHEVELVAPGAAREIVVRVRGEDAPVAGRLAAEVSDGWGATVAEPAFRAGPGTPAEVRVRLAAPGAAGTGRLRLHAEVGGRRYSSQRAEIRYAHIPTQLLQPPAVVRLVAADVRTAARRVGYLPGAGDDTERALAQLGCAVRRLRGADLSPAGLAGLDAVVIGVRAFNERDDLAGHLPGLFAWVEQGGTVVAQYNRPNGLAAPTLGPHPLSIQGPAPQLRVTDERAPVTFLLPDHPVLHRPNRLGPADFAGWVQERGAYFPATWDEARWAAPLAMADPGEAPLRGSLLVAAHGRGRYIYTGLALFRQLPAGVPGAYRLLANLIAPAR